MNAVRNAVIAVALAAAGARASSVTDELTLNSTQATETNPRSGSISNSLRASLDLAEPLSLDLGAMLTSQSNSPSELPNQTGDAAVALLSAGLDWEVTDNWTLSPHGEWSPQTTQFADASIQLLAGTGTAHIRSVSSEVAGGLDVSYDTAGESDLEWSFDGGINFTHWSIDQSVPRVTNVNNVVVTSATVRSEVAAVCARRPSKDCGKVILKELAAAPFALDSQELSLAASATVKRDTDLTLSVDYYNYVQDPSQAGYASLIFNGRGGAGVPVAPLRFMIRPEVLHRFGELSASLWLQAGQYVPGTGGDTTAAVGIKLQYKFSKAFRLWGKLLAQRDVDSTGADTKSGTFALGAGYRF